MNSCLLLLGYGLAILSLCCGIPDLGSELPQSVLLNQELIEYVSNKAREAAKTHTNLNVCPDGFPKALCNQPATFYLWVRELRHIALRKQFERSLAIQLLRRFMDYARNRPRLRQVYVEKLLALKKGLLRPTLHHKAEADTPPTIHRKMLNDKKRRKALKLSLAQQQEAMEVSRNTFRPPYRHILTQNRLPQ